jgi:PadR family transcriptional regulator PadR
MLHLDASRKRETFVPDKSSDLVHGTLEVLVLKTLALEPIHGYGISVRIEQMSRVVISRN